MNDFYLNSPGSKVGEEDINLGKYWAALRGDVVVGMISMKAPSDVVYEEYRKKAVDCLAMIGTVKSGVMIERKGECYFIRPPTHEKRRRNPAPWKEIWVPQSRKTYISSIQSDDND